MKWKWIWVVSMMLLLLATPGMVVSTHNVHTGVYVGDFEYSNGNVKGKFVSFQINPRTGEIKNYTVNNVTFFEEIKYQNLTMGKLMVHGAMLFYRGIYSAQLGVNHTHKNHTNNTWGYMWRAVMSHDNPSGVLHIVTHGRDVIEYKLSSGINATLSNSSVSLEFNGTYAYMFFSNGKVKLYNGTIYIKTGDKNSTSSVIFIEPSHIAKSRSMKKFEMRALQKYRLGGEMYIAPNATDFVNYTYGLNAKLGIKERNHIRIQIDARGVEAGKIIVVSIDKSVMNLSSNKTIIVKLDGKNINRTSMENLLNESSQAGYVVSYTNDTVDIAIYVPHFSEHFLDVESEASFGNGNQNEGNTNENSELGGLTSAMLWGIVITVIVVIAVIIALTGWKMKKH